MCGIAGVISRAEHSSDYFLSASAMTEAVHHRGPDGGNVEMVNRLDPAVLPKMVDREVHDDPVEPRVKAGVAFELV